MQVLLQHTSFIDETTELPKKSGNVCNQDSFSLSFKKHNLYDLYYWAIRSQVQKDSHTPAAPIWLLVTE